MRQRPDAPPAVRCKGCSSEFDPCLWGGRGDNPAHIIVISSNPSGFSIGRGEAFFGPTGRLFKRLLDVVRSHQGEHYADLKVYTTYAVLAGAVNPNANHIQYCRHFLHGELSRVRGVDGREPVIVALGALVLKALGVNFRKITDIVGHEMTVSLPSPQGPRPLKVIPLFEMESVRKSPGYTTVVLAALLRAAKLATGDASGQKLPLDVLTKDYRFPKTIDEVKQLVEEIQDYSAPGSKLGAQNWMIALDTETNTLYPETHPDPKVLMLSVAWDQGKAATILLDHELTPYDKEMAWEHVKRLLLCPKPKAFHHWKFDRKFLVLVKNLLVYNVVWDTLCGEHYSDEDKKGLYGLKKLTAIYTPDYAGYDEELQSILRGKDDVDKEGLISWKEEDICNELVAPCGREQPIWDQLKVAIWTRTVQKAQPKELQDRVIIDGCNKEIAQLYKRLDLKKPGKLKMAKKSGGFEDIPLDTILRYAAVDADVARMIAKVQLHRLTQTGIRDEALYVMQHIYLPASAALGDMEFRGFKVDMDYLTQLEKEIGEMLCTAERMLKDNFGPINYRSIPQVMSMLSRLSFERIPGADGTSTDKEVLERYISYYPIGDPRREFAEGLLTFRAAEGAKGKFLKGLRKLSADDGKIHCNFNLTSTATGRLSSSDPNMQNIAPHMCRIVRKLPDGTEEEKHPGFNIKKLFVPANPDNLIVNVDIKGAELRVYTAYSHDEKMIEVLLSGRDVHSSTAAEIYGIPYEQIELERHFKDDIKDKRDRAKRVVFGTFYGAGPFKISEQIKDTKEEAQRIINLLFAQYPKLRAYINDTKEQVRSRQMVKTHFGRYRRFKLAHASREHMADAVRQAVNFLIQSTASDLVLGQLCEISDHIGELNGELLITVHDSMTFEIPRSVVNLETRVDDRGKKKLFDTKGDLHRFFDQWIVKRVAEKYDWLPVPFLYDIELGPSYGEMKEVHRG